MKDKLTFRVLQASQPRKLGTFYASAAHEGVIVAGGHQGNDAFYCWSVGGKAFQTRSGRALKTQRVTGIAPFGEGSFILGNWERTWILDARSGKAEELILNGRREMYGLGLFGFASNASGTYAVGSGPKILHAPPGSRNFKPVVHDIPEPPGKFGIHFHTCALGPDALWIAGEISAGNGSIIGKGGTLHRLVGKEIALLAHGPVRLADVCVGADGSAFTIDVKGMLRRYSPEGKPGKPVRVCDQPSAMAWAPTGLMVATYEGGLFLGDAEGKNWRPLKVPVRAALGTVHASDGRYLIGGAGGLLLEYADSTTRPALRSKAAEKPAPTIEAPKDTAAALSVLLDGAKGDAKRRSRWERHRGVALPPDVAALLDAIPTAPRTVRVGTLSARPVDLEPLGGSKNRLEAQLDGWMKEGFLHPKFRGELADAIYLGTDDAGNFMFASTAPGERSEVLIASEDEPYTDVQCAAQTTADFLRAQAIAKRLDQTGDPRGDFAGLKPVVRELSTKVHLREYEALAEYAEAHAVRTKEPAPGPLLSRLNLTAWVHQALIGKPSFFEPDQVNEAFSQNRSDIEAYERKTLKGRFDAHDHFQGSFWLFYTYLTADNRAPEVIQKCRSSRSPWVRDVAALIERALAGDATSKALKLLRARRGVIET